MPAQKPFDTPYGTGNLQAFKLDCANGVTTAFGSGAPRVSSSALSAGVYLLTASENCFVTLEGSGSPSLAAGESNNGTFGVGKFQDPIPIQVAANEVLSVLGDGTAGSLFAIPAARVV